MPCLTNKQWIYAEKTRPPPALHRGSAERLPVGGAGRAAGTGRGRRPCALYGKALKRTRGFASNLGNFSCVRAVSAPIHPIDFDFHPMDFAIHPMESPIQGLFPTAKWLRFVPHSGENRVSRRLGGGASHGCALLSGVSDFRVFASEGALARKYSIFRVKKAPRAGSGRAQWSVRRLKRLATTRPLPVPNDTVKRASPGRSLPPATTAAR